MHKDYIVENLCINQSKPEMDCEGKCYLKKQIVSEVTKNAGRSTNLPDETNTNYFTPHFTTSSEGIYLFPIYIDLKTDFFAWDGARYQLKDGTPGKLEGAIDLSAGLEFKITKNINLWTQFNNVFNKEYQRWNQYPVYGFNFVGGVVFSFDQKTK